MDKRLFIHLQGGRKVSGTLRGYDLFLNLVVDDAQEETTPAQRHPIGTIVRCMISSFPPRMSVDIANRLFAETALLRWRRWKR
jgi:small nuclear ribonucleoprotein (snRNP)-like protein